MIRAAHAVDRAASRRRVARRASPAVVLFAFVVFGGMSVIFIAYKVQFSRWQAPK